MIRKDLQQICKTGLVNAGYIVLGILLGLNALSYASDGLPRFSVGFSTKSFPNVDAKDANAAIRLWASEIGAQAKMQPESTIYDDVKTMVADFLKERIDFISIPVVDYLKNEANLPGVLGYVGVRNGKTTQRYVILANADKAGTPFLSLKNRKLALSPNDELGTLFLNTWLLRQNKLEMDRFFSVIEAKQKHSQTIHAVYFGSADVCVVPESAFNTMVELSPQVGRKLKAIAVSAELTTEISLFRKKYPKMLRDKMDVITGTLKDYPRGKQILTLFQVDRLMAINDADLAETHRLYREYRRLKGKLL